MSRDRQSHFRAWSVAPEPDYAPALARREREGTFFDGDATLAARAELAEDDETWAAEPVVEEVVPAVEDARPKKKRRRIQKQELCLTPVVERIGRPFFEATHVLGHRLADVEPCGAPARDAGDGQPSDVRWPAPPEDDVPDADGKHYYPRAVVAGETIQPGDVVEVFGEWNVGRTTRARERDELERLLKEGSPSYVPRRNSQTEVWMMLVRYLYEDADGVGHVHGSWFEKASDKMLGPSFAPPNEYYVDRACYDMRLDAIIGKSSMARPSDDDDPPTDRPFYRYLHIPSRGTWTNPDEPALDDLEHLEQLKPDRCKCCFARRLEQLEDEQVVDWLRDADGHPLDGGEHTASELGILVGARQAYRLGDTIYFCSERRRRARLGKIVAICGIEAGCPDDSTVQEKLASDPGAGREATVEVIELTRFMDANGEAPFRDDRHLCFPDGNEKRSTVLARNLCGHLRILELNDAQFNPDFLHEHVHPLEDTFFVYGGGRSLPFPVAPSSAQRVKLEREDRDRARFFELLDQPTGTGPRRLRHLDLFAGVSAFHLAMDAVGLAEPSGRGATFVDHDPAAAKTLHHNFANHNRQPEGRANVVCQDVNEILKLVHEDDPDARLEDLFKKGEQWHTSDSLPRPTEVDLITAGFPCQGHSVINSWAQSNQATNQLAATTMAAVELYRPTCFIAENVRGIMYTKLERRLGGGDAVESGYLRFVVACLLRLGYQVWYGCLQAAHYGAPQVRRRVIVMAARLGHALPSFPRPTHTYTDDFLTLKIPNEPDADQVEHLSPLWLAGRRAVTVHEATSDLPEFDYAKPCPHSGWDAVLDPRVEREAQKRGHMPGFDPSPPYSADGVVGPTLGSLPRYALTTYQEAMRRGNESGNGGFKMRYHFTAPQNAATVARIWHVPLEPGADWKALARFKHLVHLKGMREGNYGRMDAWAPFPTILTRINPGSRMGTVLHPTQMRLITCLEAQRAQGIPDRIAIQAMSRQDPTADIYRQIGNSIPVPLCTALAREVLRAMMRDFRGTF